jgi:hypothetical protein
MDHMGYVYVVVSRDEARDIARKGLCSGPVQIHADGEILQDGIYFANDPGRAMRATNIKDPILVRFNVDNVSEITEIQSVNRGDGAADFVAAGPSAFSIPAIEVEYRSLRMSGWYDIERLARTTGPVRLRDYQVKAIERMKSRDTLAIRVA